MAQQSINAYLQCFISNEDSKRVGDRRISWAKIIVEFTVGFIGQRRQNTSNHQWHHTRERVASRASHHDKLRKILPHGAAALSARIMPFFDIGIVVDENSTVIMSSTIADKRSYLYGKSLLVDNAAHTTVDD